MMNGPREKLALIAAGLALLAAAVDVLLFRQSTLHAALALLPFCGLGLFSALIVYARLRLARMAEDERRDEALARAERPDASLFAAGESSPFTAARSLEQFEKWGLPLVPPLFALGLGVTAAWLYHAAAGSVARPQDPLLAASFFAGQSFFFFVLGRLLLGYSREDTPMLRGPGVALGVACFAGLIGAVASVATSVGDDARFDRYATYVLAAAAGALALEQVLRFIIALYSPRHRRPFLTAYESRLGQSIADPTAWARNFASAVDYQFGFNVSESWFYRLLRNALAPLLIFQLLALWLMSSLVFLGPDEEAVKERFGQPLAQGWQLDSGFHLKWPWPFETIQRVPARRVLTTHIGYETDDETNRPAVLTWTTPHYAKEDMYLVASRAPQTLLPMDAADRSVRATADAVAASLVSVNIPIEYRVTNLLQFVYGVQQPERILRAIANRALTREAACNDLADFLGPRRLELGTSLQTRIQRDVDAAGLGLAILFVGMQGVHPPTQVASAYESVVGALEQKEASILAARAYTNQILPVARANADKKRDEAEAYRVRRAELAAAEVEQFEKRLEAHDAAPQVYRTFAFLGALEEATRGARKYIVDAPASKQIYQFNFEEKPYQDLLDLGAPLEKKK